MRPLIGRARRAVHAPARLPIKARLTFAFLAVMLAVLAGMGTFLYFHFRAGLDAGIEQSLRVRASTISAGRPADGSARSAGQLLARGDVAQVLDRTGRVLRSSPGLGGRSLLTSAERRRARRGSVLLARDEERVLARPAGGGRVAVAGVSLEQRNKALHEFAAALLLGGPLGLLLAGAGGYGLAAAALRPVERMRQRAATISAADPGTRLPLPEARDELHRLGATLNHMLDRLEAALEHERSFVSDASHELRTPLAVLKAELELALNPVGAPDELESALRSAAEETDRLAQLAEDLLVIARADHGRLPVRARPTALAPVLADVAARFGPRARDAGRSIEIAGGAGLTAHVDSDRLRQAVSNLVDNALRHSEGLVSLRAIARDGVIEVHVTDEGRGFDPDFLERAFERFSRSGSPDHYRSRGGAGLGLAIVQAIARAHGGSAHAANRPRGGADTWLSLPANPL